MGGGFDDLVTHRREVWQSTAEPVASSSRFEWSDVDLVVAHYTADDDLPDGDPGELADNLPQYLRNMQHFYLTHPDRGYSVGYAFALDWLGGSWELRGDDFECAANKAVNSRAIAFLCLVDADDRLTAECAATFRRFTARAIKLSPLTVTVDGHGRTPGASTGCPGAGILVDLDEGRLDPRTFTPPPPPPPPVTSGDDPMFIARDLAGKFVIGDGVVRRHLPTAQQARRIIGRYTLAGAPLHDWETGEPVGAARQVNKTSGISSLGQTVVK